MESVRSWVRQADVDAGEAPGTTTEDAQRITELEAENRELKRANEIRARLDGCVLTPDEFARGFHDWASLPDPLPEWDVLRPR